MSERFRIERPADQPIHLVRREPEGEVISREGAVKALQDRRCWHGSHPDDLGQVVYRYTFPTISQDLDVQRRYERLRMDGQSHRFAEMLATRSFPGINGTDKAWNRGRQNGNQFTNCPGLGNYYRSIADRAGVSTTGKYYVHGLGRFPGDPRAWCSDTSDVLRIARERNLSLDGIVSHRGHSVEPAPDVPLAPDIVDRFAAGYLAEDPGLPLADARDRALRDHGPRPFSSSLTSDDMAVLAAGPPDTGSDG